MSINLKPIIVASWVAGIVLTQIGTLPAAANPVVRAGGKAVAGAAAKYCTKSSACRKVINKGKLALQSSQKTLKAARREALRRLENSIDGAMAFYEGGVCEWQKATDRRQKLRRIETLHAIPLPD